MINSVGLNSSIVTNHSIQSVASTSASPAGEVEFSYNPQDQVVMAPTTTRVKGVKVGNNGPVTERVTLAKTKLEANGDSYVFDQKEKGFTGAHAFATVANTLQMFENAYGSKVPWAFRQDQMKVVPDGGEMLNAYYSRGDGSVNFFHAMDTSTNQMVYSGQSGEVVSHEVGHAMLDGLRPGYLQAWSPDPGGFHESFADLTGMFMATQDDGVCELAAKQTGGDMHKPNCLAATGEELGTTINNSSGKNSTGGSYIRNAINNFKWEDPSGLPERGGPDQLGTEMHSFSRLFTGAVYDVFSDIVARNVEGGMGTAAAIKEAGAECIELYGNLMKEAPKGNFTYEQMANCMLKTDAKYMDGKNQDILRTRFTERQILHGGASMTEDVDYGATETRMMSVTLDGDGFGMFSGARVETPVDAGKMTVLDNDSSKLKSDMQRLIKAGRILYTEPNQHLETKDLFDKDGMPYMGVVRWIDGEMVIERNQIIN